jgi:hypothetical protein
VISAVNVGEEYMLTEMDPALVSRFNIYEFKPSVNEWVSWARQTGLDSRVVDFIESEPIWLDGEKSADRKDMIEKTPDRRAWERVSDLISSFDRINTSTLKLICGAVGEKAGKALAAYLAKPVDKGISFKASDVLCNFGSYKAELKKSPAHILTILNVEIFRYLSGKPDVSASEGLVEYIRMLTNEGKTEVMADFVSLFSDKNNYKAVYFIGKECYEVVIEMQKFISKI